MIPDTAPSDPNYIPSIVRNFDRDRFVAALFMPGAYRPDLFALYAFNIELTRIPELVSEPMLGEFRLQWWRDTLDQLENGERLGHPIADRLGDVMRTRRLPKMTLLGLIDARSFDVTGDAMPDMQALRAYLGKTAEALFMLSVQILAQGSIGDRRSDVEEAARLSGIAYGLTGLLRALPVHAARGIYFLPTSQFNDASVETSMYVQGEEGETLKRAFAGLIGDARTALDEARKRIADLPEALQPAFLPLAFVPPYLDKLTRPSHRPLHDLVELNPLGRLFRAWRAARFGLA